MSEQSAEKDARPEVCGCRIYYVGEPYICPTHYANHPHHREGWKP